MSSKLSDPQCSRLPEERGKTQDGERGGGKRGGGGGARKCTQAHREEKARGRVMQKEHVDSVFSLNIDYSV